MKRTLLSWSSGKDSAWTLHRLMQQGEYEIVGLLTTFNQQANRVAMHGVRRELVEAQAEAAGVPLWGVDLPWPCTNSEYEGLMREACRSAVRSGIEYIAFGDLFLRDVRQYRENQLRNSGLTAVFPLWETPTLELARAMLGSGLKAKLTCVDLQRLSSDFAGRDFDEQLLSDFAPEIDPCGENGEFHSFVYAGPMFRYELPVAVGQIISREGFVFADVTLGQSTRPVPPMEGGPAPRSPSGRRRAGLSTTQ